MRKRTRPLVSASALVIMIGAIFLAGKPEPSSGQVTPPSDAYIICCNLPVNVPATPEHALGTDHSKDRCPQYMRDNPQGRQSICDQLKPFMDNGVYCDTVAAYCKAPEDKKPKCVTRDDERTGDVPWFDPSAPGCQDLRDTQLTTTFSGGKCTYTLRACGSLVLRDTLDAPNAASCTREYRTEYYGGTAPLPQKVCCDIWQQAAGAGSDCNPEVDADCDGEPNNKTSQLRLQDPYYAPIPGTNDKNFNPADFDPLPPGLGWDEVMPNEPCKGCKWMATSAKLTCSPDKYKKMPESRKSDHEYKVTWKCPTSGVQRVVTKRVAARFPCTPPKRPTQTSTAPTFRPALLQIFSSGFLTDPRMAVLRGFWTTPCTGSQVVSNP